MRNASAKKRGLAPAGMIAGPTPRATLRYPHLVIRSDNDPKRDMKDGDIVRALQNLENAGVPLANEFHILNHWR